MNDTWLGPVLVVGGVLTPDQLAEVADAVARRFRVPLANLRRPTRARLSSSLPHSTARARKKPWISARRTT